MGKYEEIMQRVREKRFEQELEKVDEEYLRRFSESAGSYLDSAQSQYEGLGYGNSYQSYLNRRDSFNDLDYRRRVIQEWSRRNPGALDQQSASWLDSFGKDSKGILDAFSGMRNYFAQFDSEDTYKQYLADQERWSKLTDGYNPTANQAAGQAGWRRYQAAQANAPKQDETNDPRHWWKQLSNLGFGSPDTAMIQLNTQQVAQLYREMDAALSGPDSRWNQEQQETFGYLWNRDPKKAESYARALNEMLNAMQEQEEREAIREKATGSFSAGLAHTAGAILAGATGLADFQGDLIRKGAVGYIPAADGYVSPFEYSQEVTGGIGQHLNEKYGTIDEGKFILGGKGLGDLYGLGVSAAQSMTYGKLLGQVPTLITFFGSGAASAVDEAKARGATDEQALTFGAISGAAEVLTEMVPLDNLLNMGRAQDLQGLFWDVLKQGGEEFLGEGANAIITNIADYFTFGEMSTYNMAKQEYMERGMDEQEAGKQAFRDIVGDIAFDALGGFVSGSASGGIVGGGNTLFYNAYTKSQYGGFQKELVQESLGIDPDNTFAQKMQNRLNRGKNLSGGQLNRLNNQIMESDMQAIQNAAAQRLTELGETKSVDTVAAALAKQAAGGELSKAEERAIQSSKYVQRVANELNAENIRSGNYDSGWAEQIGTHRINAQEYGRMLHAAQQSESADTTEGDATVREARTVAENAPVDASKATPDASNATHNATSQQEMQLSEEKATAEDSTEVQGVTLEEAAQKYGAQAQAMIHTYQEGQDVEKYNAAYRAAFDMGRSGVNIDYVLKSPATAYLTEGQRDLAYAAGEAAANTAAHARQAEIQAAANGNTGHRKGGLVRGDGVTIADLKKAVGDTRGTAYKTLSTIAKVTGIDIVLYKSKEDDNGRFQGAQGKYRRSEPGTIYIDINAGLSHINDVNDLAKYTTLRTFCHEFTHFIENWNPVHYNEFRRVVFDTLTQRGEDVEFLIAQKQEDGLDYDGASREVVAEAMTDILPDAAFVETLANEHKTIFQKLLDKLKEFTAKVREYFASIGTNRSREANALKEQVGDTVKYLERIVNLFDSVAVEAVHNYQMTVAAEEVDISEVESTTEEAQAVAYENEATEEIAQAEDTVGDDHAATDDATISKAETVEADNTQENSNNATEDYDNETVAAETEAPAEETAFPPKAETEEAKQDLRKAVRMPIQGTNMEALLEGIKNRELSMESVTLSGSVEGFNAEQRQHLVEKLLEGVYTDSEVIKIEVPYDGKFEIVNTPGNVAKVLENLKVKARQEAIFDKKTVSLLTSNGDVRIVDVGGQKYLSNSYVMLPATEAAVGYARTELDGKENQLHPEVAKAFEQANKPLVDAPTEAKLDKTTVLIFSADGKKLFFDKRLFSPLDGGKLYYADIRGTGILKSVDVSGNVMGYLMGIRPSGKTEVTGEKPSNLKSYPKKKAQETSAQKEKPTQKTKSEPKPKAAPKAPPKVTEAKAAKPSTVETSVKLEDFGEKIGGARKDQWSKRGLLAEDLDAMNDREREKNVKKDNIWKRPDYRKLIEGGADRNILYVRNEIRKALNQNIAYPYRVSDARKQQMQEEFVATVRTIQAMAEKVTTKAELAAMGRPWLMEHGYRTENSFTEKWRKNAALQGTNYVQTIEHLVRNWDQLSKLADKANFAVDAEKKIPSGFSIHEDDSNHTWFIARGNWVVRHSIPSYEEALSYLQNAASNTKKKTRFVPEQLLEVHRKGPNYRGGKDVKGQDYLDTFGFKGGEFGNWMTEKDRRVSMNYGFDALKDLADALGIADQDISLAGNLSIAFGARGQGLSGAAAHYEQERHVINLTKMNGAGSLAHEWFHALDDFLGGYGSKFATEYGSQLPETTKAAVRHLLTTMQYRDATQEETDMAATKAYEQAKRSVTYQVSNQFGWVRRIEEGKFIESDARYYSRKPTEADVKKYHELLDKLLKTGDMAVLEELSALRKEVAGHVIPKEDRESIGYRLSSLRPDATKNVQKMRLRSDFYNNSRRFGELHHKDGDYWDSTIEMAARAFACYVADKTGKHNDYLSAHSDTAVTLDMDKDGNVNVVRAFPVGEERVQINAAFDQLIAALKADGFLHEQGETVKPEMIQYQRRSNSEDVQNPYDGKSLYGDEDIYRYDFMTAQPDMAVVEMPSLSDVKSGNKVDQKKAVELGLSNAMDLGRQVGENQFAIRNAYTGREIIVGTSGLSHGLSGENVNRLRTNARLAAIGGTIVQNAIPINGLKNKNRQASGTYAMACLLNSGDYHVVAIVTVEEHTSKAVGIDYVDITHSINGRILAKNIDSRSSTREMGHGQTSAPTTAIYKVSIADLLDIVNKTHRSILSDDVLKFFNEERPDGGFYSDRVMHQERTSPLTDRDVLAMAVDDVPVDGLTDGEKDALRIFKSRLNTLQTLQEERAEQGRIYREQQFGTNVNREAAKQTLNRMHVLDSQIQRASEEVLDVEQKNVLRQVLQKARKVVEQQERIHGQQVLKRWRDRRNESAVIRKYRDRVKATVKELNDLLLNESKKRHVPDSMKKAVAEALSLVNMDTVGADERIAKYEALIAQETDQDKIDAYTVTLENIKRQGEKVAQRLMELRNAYDEIQNSDDPDIANAYDPVIAGSLKELSQSIGNTPLCDMSAEQLSDVCDMYRMVLTRVRDANKSLLDGKNKDIKSRAANVVNEIRKAGGTHARRVALLDPVRKFLWNNLKPVFAFEHLGSKTLKEAFNSVRKGEDTWARDVSEARKYYLDKSRQYGYEGWDFKKKYRFQSQSGTRFELTLEQILSLYAYSKRDQAHDHLRLGGFVFDSNIETYKDSKGGKGIIKYKVNTADAHQITPDILAGIVGKLSEKQKQFVDEMQEYLSTTMGAKGNEVTMKMYGVKLFKEKFYFPLKSAKQFMFEQNEVSGEVKIKNAGFTNKTKPKADNPVILSNFMDVWSSHVNDMSMYHAFVLPLEDFNRIFNYNSPKTEGQAPVSVKGTIQSAYSPAAVHYVKELITDLNGGAVSDPRETTGKAMMSKFKKAAVLASFSVAAQQPSSIGKAFAVIDPKYFVGERIDHKRHKALWEEVKKYAPVAIIKEMGYFDTGMGRSGKDFLMGKEYDGLKEKAVGLIVDENYRDEVLGKGAAYLDELTWCAIWQAVKRETKERHPQMSIRSEEFLTLTGERFTEVITKTQVYDSTLSRSANMRSKSAFMGMLTAFMGESTTTINMMEDALRKGLKGDVKYAAKVTGAVFTSLVLNSLLSSFVYAVRDDDEDEFFYEKWAQSFAVEILDGINPLTYYPMLKDIWSVFQGFDIERADMSLVTSLAEAMTKLVQLYSKDTDSMNPAQLESHEQKLRDAWWGMVDYAAALTGIPVKNVRRDINGILNSFKTISMDLTDRDASWGALLDKTWDQVKNAIPVIGWMPDETMADKLYDATVNGDEAYRKRLESTYEDQNSLNTAIRKGLRENDTRIWEAAIAWNENDLERYMALAREIVKERHFSQDNVVLAIRAEAEAMPAG